MPTGVDVALEETTEEGYAPGTELSVAFLGVEGMAPASAVVAGVSLAGTEGAAFSRDEGARVAPATPAATGVAVVVAVLVGTAEAVVTEGVAVVVLGTVDLSTCWKLSGCDVVEASSTTCEKIEQTEISHASRGL